MLMKIESINLINIGCKNKIKDTSSKVFLNELPCDKFVKCANTSFGSKRNFDDLYRSNCDEIISYAICSKKPSLSGAKALLSSISRDVKIFPFDKDEFSKDLDIRACYVVSYNLKSVFGRKIISGVKRAIYVKPPIDNLINERFKFARALLHEAIHLMQDKAADRLTHVDYVSKYLPYISSPTFNNLDNELDSLIISITAFIYNNVEYIVNVKDIGGDRINCYYNDCMDRLAFLLKYKLKNIDTVYFSNKANSSVSRQYFYDNLKLSFLNEIEAYTKANLFFFKNVQENQDKADIEKLRIRFFNKVIRIIDGWMVEQKD